MGYYNGAIGPIPKALAVDIFLAPIPVNSIAQQAERRAGIAKV